jgi:hypothetical protein
MTPETTRNRCCTGGKDVPSADYQPNSTKLIAPAPLQEVVYPTLKYFRAPSPSPFVNDDALSASPLGRW